MTVPFWVRAHSRASRATATTSRLPGAGLYTGTSICSASVASWSTAAGRTRSQATSRGRRPSFFRRRASFALVVVLPAPFRPTTMILAGSVRSSPTASPPSRAAISSRKILTICSPGLMDLSTSCPMARSFTRPMNSRATPNSTSASSKASRMSRRASAMFFSEILPRPRSFRNVLSSLSAKSENIIV